MALDHLLLYCLVCLMLVLILCNKFLKTAQKGVVVPFYQQHYNGQASCRTLLLKVRHNHYELHNWYLIGNVNSQFLP